MFVGSGRVVAGNSATSLISAKNVPQVRLSANRDRRHAGSTATLQIKANLVINPVTLSVSMEKDSVVRCVTMRSKEKLVLQIG